MVLFIDACVRDDSRTRKLSEALLSKLGGEVKRVPLKDIVFRVSDQSFLEKRDELIAKRQFDDEMFVLARDFAQAETIVIAAPY